MAPCQAGDPLRLHDSGYRKQIPGLVGMHQSWTQLNSNQIFIWSLVRATECLQNVQSHLRSMSNPRMIPWKGSGPQPWWTHPLSFSLVSFQIRFTRVQRRRCREEVRWSNWRNPTAITRWWQTLTIPVESRWVRNCSVSEESRKTLWMGARVRNSKRISQSAESSQLQSLNLPVPTARSRLLTWTVSSRLLTMLFRMRLKVRRIMIAKWRWQRKNYENI